MNSDKKGSAGRKARTSSPVTKIFAERLSDLIDEKKKDGQSQKEIAASIGVSSGALSEWADDKKTPTIDALEKLSRYFGVPSDYLLGLTDDPSKLPAAVDDLGLDETTVSALVECRRFRPAGSSNDYALKLLDALVQNCSIPALGQHYEVYLRCKLALTNGAAEYEKFKDDLPGYISKEDYLENLRFQKKNAEFQLLFDLSAMFDR